MKCLKKTFSLYLLIFLPYILQINQRRINRSYSDKKVKTIKSF